MKDILVLGSTGSIGVNTLNVVKMFPHLFRAKILTANSNVGLLEKQISEFKPQTVVVREHDAFRRVKERAAGECEILEGDAGLLEVTRRGNYDILLSALVGFAGLAPTVEAIRLGKRIALANKETLVAAGDLINKLSLQFNAEIIPVDSEHSAIFQCLQGEKSSEVEKLIITASGGPFLNKSIENVSVEEALNHPNWKMGAKITIDSASMMNKGLEVIEARWLFGLGKDKIDVVVHPQSIVHSMVQFVDGSVKAQMGLPDMKLPIQYALTYPDRLENKNKRTNFPAISDLTFLSPDIEKFDCLKIAYEAIKAGGMAPCIMNAANEVAVAKFLKGQIKFKQIPALIRKTLEKTENHSDITLENVFECDAKARELTAALPV
jgi:1-deoxy-D-xylulose-5-phosphate reductoisomerase